MESANAETAIFAVRKVEDIVVDRAEPAEGRPARALAAEFGPIVAPRQPLLQPPVPDIPIANEPSPVVTMRLAVGWRGGLAPPGHAQRGGDAPAEHRFAHAAAGADR